MKRIILLLGIFLIASILFDCAPRIEESPAPKAPVEKIEPVVKEVWELEWDRTLAEARKEGLINLLTTAAPIVRQALTEGFTGRTGIPLHIVTGRGGEISAKLLTEQRAGLFLADVYMGGTTTLTNVIKPGGALAPLKALLFLPEVLDENLWYKNTLPWLDKDQLILQTRYMRGGEEDVTFMKGRIDKREMVSWYDLLNPKLKGLMNIQDPTTAGKGGSWVNKAITYDGLDWDYMKALAKQELFVTRDKRLQVEWIARGKHILGILADTETADEFIAAGAPLEYIFLKESKDILGGGSSGLALIDKAPNPNAAKLFINWFLSKEGQTSFAKSYGVQSAREDVPTDHLPSHKIRKPGVDYPVETEEFLLQHEKIIMPKAREIFGPLLK